MDKLVIYQIQEKSIENLREAIQSAEIHGVVDMFVDGLENQIHVTYRDGEEDHFDEIPKLVNSLGYKVFLYFVE